MGFSICYGTSCSIAAGNKLMKKIIVVQKLILVKQI